MTPRIVTAAALFALGAASIAALVLLGRTPSDAQPAVAPDGRAPSTTGSTTTSGPHPKVGAQEPPADRQPIADPVARLKRLYGIDPRRSDVNGKFVGE